jgi:hypothetical protein
MNNKQIKQVIELLSTIDLDVWENDVKDIETIDELDEFLQENNYFDVEIIYYTNAMDYLHEHDNSLQLSLGLAHDMGYTVENINSELLASLLASEKMRENFAEIREELETILN